MSAVERAAIGDAANSVGSSEHGDLAGDLQELASPIERGEKVMVAIERAAHRAGLPRWRTFNIWYGKARAVTPEERAAVAAALDEKRRAAARNEVHELRARLMRLESMLAQIDPDFHRDTLDQLRRQRR